MIARFLHRCLPFAARLALFCGVVLPLYAQTDPRADSCARPIAFISDTQTPLWLESLVFGNDRNAEATDSLFADILRLHPASLFMLGDLVSLGPYPRAWESMDIALSQLHAAHVPVHAILGNHEVMYLPRTGERLFQESFPDHVRTGYACVVDSVAVVLLNSNFESLREMDRQTQNSWYGHMLDSLERDPAVRFVVVCCHHAPFSNSTVVGSSEATRTTFVPPFLARSKCTLFLSGHAHTFEHFRAYGKDFAVIGGGGGSRHPVRTGADQDWPDISPQGKPFFHFITLAKTPQGLRLRVRQLRDDYSSMEDGYSAMIGGNTE